MNHLCWIPLRNNNYKFDKTERQLEHQLNVILYSYICLSAFIKTLLLCFDKFEYLMSFCSFSTDQCILTANNHFVIMFYKLNMQMIQYLIAIDVHLIFLIIIDVWIYYLVDALLTCKVDLLSLIDNHFNENQNFHIKLVSNDIDVSVNYEIKI